MKLFLASAFDQSVKSFEEKVEKLQGKKVIFIENPSDNHTGDKWWVRIDREAFEKNGATIIDADLRDITYKELEQKCDSADIVHFCGGSALYTISLLKEKGLAEIIVKYVRNGKLAYTGTSAGSMIVSEDLSLGRFDPEEKPSADKMEDFSGLGLVNFLIMPHANNKDFAGGNAEAVKHLPDYSQPLFFLYDGQALLVDDNHIEITGS